MSVPVGVDEYRERLLALCARPGPSSLPRRRKDRLIVLHALSRRLAAPGPMSEREVTERIAAWLAGTGSAFDTDPVSLRRALIDDGFLRRDPSGHAYTRGAHRSHLDFDRAIEALDVDGLVDQERLRQLDQARARTP